jgi:hypothetical protein
MQMERRRPFLADACKGCGLMRLLDNKKKVGNDKVNDNTKYLEM